MKEDWINTSTALLNNYIESFGNLTEEQENNFTIKKEHSLRVAEVAQLISAKLKLNEIDTAIAFLSALFHDIGRFSQLVEYNTFDDLKSVDHAELSVEILKKEGFLQQLGCSETEIIYAAILEHNKFEVSKKLNEQELLHARILRDADKLDILKVLTDYYTQRNIQPNHTLTWGLPKGNSVSENVSRDVLTGKLVQKKDVASEVDVKIMQLSWIYDLNFKSSVEFAFQKRFFEKIYSSLPKNDKIIDIYRKIKVFGENKMLE